MNEFQDEVIITDMFYCRNNPIEQVVYSHHFASKRNQSFLDRILGKKPQRLGLWFQVEDIGPLDLENLSRILRPEDTTETFHQFAPVFGSENLGFGVLKIPDSFRDQISALTSEDIENAADLWSKSEEFRGLRDRDFLYKYLHILQTFFTAKDGQAYLFMASWSSRTEFHDRYSFKEFVALVTK